jgi:membrane-associated phospholipid phosphatase
MPEASKDTVSTAVLVIVSLLAPAAIVVVVSFVLIPSPRALRGAPFALIFRRKVWEWIAGWMGLGVTLAATFMATQGLKDLIGKPRPDLLARCDPDLSKIATYVVGGLGRTLTGAPTLVTAGICRNQDSSLVNDGFASFPSGHASCKYLPLGPSRNMMVGSHGHQQSPLPAWDI